jgi:membrane protein
MVDFAIETSSRRVAAGSLVIILVWTYYSAQILFFGAELIRAYAQHFDRRFTSLEPASPSEAQPASLGRLPL